MRSGVNSFAWRRLRRRAQHFASRLLDRTLFHDAEGSSVEAHFVVASLELLLGGSATYACAGAHVDGVLIL